MKTTTFSHRIRLFTSLSSCGRVWNVQVDTDHQAIFSGENGKSRALDYAFRQAELFRTTGGVVVVVDDGGPAARVTNAIGSKLAS